VFYTAAESFRSMSSPAGCCPPGDATAQLLEMDTALAVSSMDMSKTMLKLWALQGYDEESRQGFVPLLRGSKKKSLQPDKYGDVLLHCHSPSHVFQ
jgi:hypothetical protein